MPDHLRRAVAPATAVALCVAVGLCTARPGLGADETAALAARFSFTTTRLAPAPADPRSQRPVQPALEHIRGWISAVGAAVALTDLRGQRHQGDVCLVDPRDDSVTVFPAPGAGGPGYDRFALDPAPLPLDATMAPMGCVPADLNEDGAMDLLVYYWGRSPVLFVNERRLPGTPSAADFRAEELVAPTQVWNSTALNVADVDGDGHLDVVVGNYFPDGARVLDVRAGDDGRMAMQDSMGMGVNGGTNRLLLATPTGEPGAVPDLVDVSTAFPDESARSWTLAFGLQDLTGDQLPEMYVANDFGPDQLLVNHSTPGSVRLTRVDGDRDLTTPRSQVLGHDSFKGMGVRFTYPDGADSPTIAVSNITSEYALHESNFAFVPTGPGTDLLRGELPYDERSEELGLARSGWAWDIKAADLDNSGGDELIQALGFLKGDRDRWPMLQELAMGNDQLLRLPGAWPKFGPGDDLSGDEHNPLFVRAANGRYHDLAHEIGIATPYMTRGFAVGDVDGDNLLDVVAANQWNDSVLLRNTARDTPRAADLRLVVPGAAGGERDAVGARVELRDPRLPQTTQVYPANGHAGVSASTAHVVLPDDEAEVVITWRAGGGTGSAQVRVRPGHHTVLLGDDGTAVLR
ncbi:FG-GAP repeat domain-containing protein [Saccharothrix lopnurensis]|uniref:FG-GAP repeat domain-containing protein n=1 Tax=Saccharothrix lopnurensis TaxID=1670621 RepID=A0ABW1PIE9_9PSEU